MTQAKISVLIPVYNVEIYLRQCLDSIVHQSLRELQIICINDGSTDDSLRILNEYAQTDNRIEIINQVNGGTGNALNNGMKNATGEYMAFVGSDDWLEPTMYQQLYEKAKAHAADITFCEHAYLNSETGEIYQPESLKIPLSSDLDNSTFQWTEIPDSIFQINSGPCNKIFKTELVKTIDAKFAQGLYYQDILFVFQCMLAAKKLNYIRKPLYVIRYLRPGSTTSDKGRKQFDIFEVMHQLELVIKIKHSSELLKSKFEEYKRAQYLHHFNLIDRSYKKEFWDSMQSELNQLAKPTGKFEFQFIMYKIHILEKLKSLSFFILGKHALRFTKLYRALQGRIVR
jgi:glycosyltransferase involved in cell wall biosynthesis